MSRLFGGRRYRGRGGDCDRKLFLQLCDFAPRIGSLARLHYSSIVEVFAQFSVLPQKVKRKERSDSHKNQEKDGKKFNKFHRLWVSLVVPDLLSADTCSNVRTAKSQNLAVCSEASLLSKRDEATP